MSINPKVAEVKVFVSKKEMIYMAYRCDYCGAYLDPGEKCTCLEEKEEWFRLWNNSTEEDQNGQLVLSGLGDTAGTGNIFTDDLPF